MFQIRLWPSLHFFLESYYLVIKTSDVAPHTTVICMLLLLPLSSIQIFSSVLTVKNPTRCNSVSTFYYSLF
jgi:hypothetical protein